MLTGQFLDLMTLAIGKDKRHLTYIPSIRKYFKIWYRKSNGFVYL